MKFLTINDQGRLTICQGQKKTVLVCQTFDAYADAVTEAAKEDGGHIMSSSSIDFPEEYTRDPLVIEYCRALRSIP